MSVGSAHVAFMASHSVSVHLRVLDVIAFLGPLLSSHTPAPKYSQSSVVRGHHVPMCPSGPGIPDVGGHLMLIANETEDQLG